MTTDIFRYFWEIFQLICMTSSKGKKSTNLGSHQCHSHWLQIHPYCYRLFNHKHQNEHHNYSIANTNQHQVPEISFFVVTFAAKITEPITIEHDPVVKGEKCGLKELGFCFVRRTIFPNKRASCYFLRLTKEGKKKPFLTCFI